MCIFGEIIDGEMELSQIGKIADRCWLGIPKHFPFVQLNEFVIMPNHVHGIITINKPDDEGNVDTHAVETQYFASLPTATIPKNKFGPQSQNLASIIRGFKIGVTKSARSINPKFTWQSRFYDHIIRNEKSFYRIAEYIINNPGKWQEDKLNPENIKYVKRDSGSPWYYNRNKSVQGNGITK